MFLDHVRGDMRSHSRMMPINEFLVFVPIVIAVRKRLEAMLVDRLMLFVRRRVTVIVMTGRTFLTQTNRNRLLA